MLIRSVASILIVASSFVLVTGQTPDAKKGANKSTKPTSQIQTERARDLSFSTGVDLQFLIKELAREVDLNVLFDPESFRGQGRKTFIELKNVTVAEALNYILVQEKLISEQIGPKTIIVAGNYRETSIPQIGVGVTPMTEQLAQYFRVEGGILINTVRPNSPAAKAELKAGDVIVEVDGVAVRGALGVIKLINDKNEVDVTLKIVRDRKRKTISLTPEKGIKIR
ncbi:hypothetical protein BH10ACI3_BH10ACI3_24580 [soil metagenome]